MRFYEISLTPPNGSSPTKVWSSQTNGLYNPSAQNIEFDMLVAPFATPVGGQAIQIEGISLKDLTQAQQYTNWMLTMKAGMQAGLPLANPKQAGTIISGQIWQSFGNWQGTEMTLDFVIVPGLYGTTRPGNLVLNWKKGATLKSALEQTFSAAYSYPVSINISDLYYTQDDVAYFSSLENLASHVLDITLSLNNPVSITIQAGKILVYDQNYKPSPIQINFTDLVGQPTWIEPNVMQVKTVMRADLLLGAVIQMPKDYQNIPGLVQTYPQSAPSQLQYKSAFQGTFTVSELRQIGNFRSPDSAQWVTIFNCIPNG